MENIVLSIHPQYAELIENKNKIFEIRTRKLHISKNTRVWIYQTSPKSYISFGAVVEDIIEISPYEAWQKYEKQMCVKKSDFEKYVGQREKIVLIKFAQILPLSQKMSLAEIRLVDKAFCPPQFFRRIETDGELCRILSSQV